MIGPSLAANATLTEVTYGYFEVVDGHLVLHGVQGAAAHVVSGVADGVGLGGPAEGHLGRGDGGLGGALVVAVDAVGGQQDGDDEGQQHRGGDDRLAHLVAYRLWIG